MREVTQRQVDEFQRARILAAMTQVACEEGPEHASVTKVIARVRVSRGTFYSLFADRQECLLAVIDEALARAADRMAGAWRAQGAWVQRLRGALWELLVLLEGEPDLARLCLARLYADDPAMRARRTWILHALVSALQQGADTGGQGGPAPALTAEGLVGALASILYTRLLDPHREPLRDLLGPLMAVLVHPYLGADGARAELSRPAPTAARPALGGPESGGPAARAPVDGSPGQGVARGRSRIRLTYRTVRVLGAIAAEPGVSNRTVAAAAGVRDQGQISRLLARLEHLGLIENARGHGGANVWQLTPEGQELARSLALADQRP